MHEKLKNLILAALFCALTVVAAMFIKLPMPAETGYVHLGDAVIFLAAVFLPLPYAAAAGAVGAALADLLLGWSFYAPFTLVVKAAMVLCFLVGGRKNPSRIKYILQSLLAGVVMAAGYFASDLILYGAPGAIANLPGNGVQAAASSVVFALLLCVIGTSAVKKQLRPRL